MPDDRNFLTERIGFRGGRTGPRWVLVSIVVLILGVFLLIGHQNVAGVVVGIVLVLAAPTVFCVFTAPGRISR